MKARDTSIKCIQFLANPAHRWTSDQSFQQLIQTKRRQIFIQLTSFFQLVSLVLQIISVLSQYQFRMIQPLWKKQIVIKVELSKVDIADWIRPLPLFIQAKWNHYLGFYLPLIYEFFQPFLPYPHSQQQLTLKLQQRDILLSGTEIISHLFVFYAQPGNTPLALTCQLRQRQALPQLDLKKIFKQNLKASTCIRYGKFGAKTITVDMSVNNIEDMFNNFANSRYQDYLGETEPQGTRLGYRFIVENKEQIENVPVRVIGNNWRIERSVKKVSTLEQFWSQLGAQKEELPCLHGVKIREMRISFEKLQQYCHPDGFLYFTF